MAFKAQQINVDLLNKQATVVAYDQPFTGGPAPMVQITFPFDPPPSEGMEKDKALAAAKAILQKAANEL